MNVLVVEDQELVREGLTLLIARMEVFDTCLSAVSLADAERVLSETSTRVDLALVDLGLPDGRGSEVLRRMRELVPDARLVVCSGERNAATIRGAFAQGAEGYLTKNATAASFRAALETVLRGERYVPPEILAVETPDVPPRSARGPEHALTPRQKAVLRLLAGGLANKEIAAELEMSPATVRAHVSAILRALGVENRTQAALSPAALALLEREPSS